MMTWSGEGWGWPLGLLIVGCWALVVVASVWCVAVLTRSTSASARASRHPPRLWSRRATSQAAQNSDPAADRSPTTTGERS